MGRKPHYCSWSGKLCYHSRAEAEAALRRISREEHTHGTIYRCNCCHHWHLTHYTYEDKRRLENRSITIRKDIQYLKHHDYPTFGELVIRLIDWCMNAGYMKRKQKKQMKHGKHAKTIHQQAD